MTIGKLRRLASILTVLMLTLAGNGGTSSAYDPYAAYTPEERAKLEADAKQRAAEKQNTLDAVRWQDTITDEAVDQASREGGTRTLDGIKSRGLDVFEGRMASTVDPYNGWHRYHYDKGTYLSNPTLGFREPIHGLYRGDFLYFQDNTGSPYVVKGTYVMIGTLTRDDGTVEKGIFVAENAYAQVPLRFHRATPDYLNLVEQRYHAQVTAYREAELRRQREEEADAESLFSFGQVLGLGLGGLMVAGADIPGADRFEIGAALFQDILTEGESNALAAVAGRVSGDYMPSTIAGDGVPTGFSAILTGDTRTLDADMAARQAPSSPVTTGASSVAGGVQAAAAGSSMDYSFTCPSGTSSTITIPYKTNACLAAKKDMARIYACNLIDDFPKVTSHCRDACGSPQCAE